LKPVGEGIARTEPLSQDGEAGPDRSFLKSLSESGEQYVHISKVHKKNAPLMFPHPNSEIRSLDGALAALAVCDKTVKWRSRYLVDKAEVAQA
jgi:hypothetical protein